MRANVPKGMGGGPQNMQAMFRQAQKMQEDMAALQEELDAREYDIKAGGGVVEVKINVDLMVVRSIAFAAIRGKILVNGIFGRIGDFDVDSKIFVVFDVKSFVQALGLVTVKCDLDRKPIGAGGGGGMCRPFFVGRIKSVFNGPDRFCRRCGRVSFRIFGGLGKGRRSFGGGSRRFRMRRDRRLRVLAEIG